MTELLDRELPLGGAAIPAVEVDESAARAQLRGQIAKLEGELAELFAAVFPRKGLDWRVRARGGPRILSLSELEAVRDELADRLQRNRRELGERTYVEELNRCRLEQMLLAPQEHKWVRISTVDIGEPGCKNWHVRPRFGLLGMLLNWWRVRISSGCPLAGRHGRRP